MVQASTQRPLSCDPPLAIQHEEGDAGGTGRQAGCAKGEYLHGSSNRLKTIVMYLCTGARVHTHEGERLFCWRAGLHTITSPTPQHSTAVNNTHR